MEVKYLLDADLPRALYHGLVRRAPELDIRRVQEVGLTSATDAEILMFAGSESRITVSRDKATMLAEAVERIERRETMPGLLLVRPRFARRHGFGLGVVIEELLLLAQCSEAEEWRDVIQFIPIFGS